MDRSLCIYLYLLRYLYINQLIPPFFIHSLVHGNARAHTDRCVRLSFIQTLIHFCANKSQLRETGLGHGSNRKSNGAASRKPFSLSRGIFGLSLTPAREDREI